MAKKTNKSGSSWAVPFVIAATALVALLGVTTKGYTDWTFGLGVEEPPVSEEVPGTSEELPGTSEEQPNSSEELPGTSEELPIITSYTYLIEAEDYCSYPGGDFEDGGVLYRDDKYSGGEAVYPNDLSWSGIDSGDNFGENTSLNIEIGLDVAWGTEGPGSLIFVSGDYEKYITLGECGEGLTSIQFDWEENLSTSFKLNHAQDEGGHAYVDYIKITSEKPCNITQGILLSDETLDLFDDYDAEL